MSTTKIVIIVLVLVGVLFIIFVVRGAVRSEPTPTPDKTTAAQTRPPDWAETVKGLFSSLQPKAELQQSVYCAHKVEPIKADDKQAFRMVTFHLVSVGGASISYRDLTSVKDMDNPQTFNLPQDDPNVKDKQSGSIVVFKRGGTLTFDCKPNTACRVEVDCSPASDARCRKKC